MADELLKAAIEKATEQKRDDKGKFLPKKPLEFTMPHFWLEVAEIAVGILIAQIIIEGVTYLVRS